MAEKKRLLVVGGTGFIGHHLTKSATQRGYEVTSLSLQPVNLEKQVANVEYVASDITSLPKLEEVLSNRKFEYVVNLSGYINHAKYLQGGQGMIGVHFEGVQNLLKVLNWDQLKTFVQIGSSDEYGGQKAPQHEGVREMPISPYSLAKVASSQMLQMLHRTEGFPAVTLRLFLVYGPGQDQKRFIPQIITGCLKGESFPTSKGQQLRDFCHVADIINGVLAVLNNEGCYGEIINLASGKAITIRKMIETIVSMIGSGDPKFGTYSYRSGENMELYAQISKARKLLYWTPSKTLDEGLRETIDYYQRLH